MLYRKRLATFLVPAAFCLSACATQDVVRDAEPSVAADDTRVSLHLRELTSDRSEELSRRNGIESEPDMNRPEVLPDPN